MTVRASTSHSYFDAMAANMVLSPNFEEGRSMILPLFAEYLLLETALAKSYSGSSGSSPRYREDI